MSINASSVIMVTSSVTQESYHVRPREVVHFSLPLLVHFCITVDSVSEICSLRILDLDLDRSHSIILQGKGRKERNIPLWKDTILQLHRWLGRIDSGDSAPLFPNRNGDHMTRSGVEDRLKRAVGAAAIACPSLVGRAVSPHTLRHTTAMHLLQSGVSESVIALWLGHESVTTTHKYIEADLTMKQRALCQLQKPVSLSLRYKPSDKLLAFLEAL